MSLESMVEAMRADGADIHETVGGDDAELVAATQLRVRRSLEGRARGRQRLIGVAAMFAILFVGTVSWALATGRASVLWRPAVPPSAPEPEPAGAAPRASRQSIALPTPPVLPPETLPAVPANAVSPEPLPALVAPAAPVAPVHSAEPPMVDAPPVPVEALYRRAHDLHFHGGDPAATLAAWDAYLAAEPDGRFSVDARYNRALTLIRLARYAEARAALEPFARGELAGGYRQAEAEQLALRLARFR